MPTHYKFVPAAMPQHTIIADKTLCDNCCFQHTDNMCRPCRSTQRRDGKNGYWINKKITLNHKQ